jgi:hypothetical protein
MLRLELRDGSFHLFPYASLERAQYSPAQSADNLTLTFSDKSASITGRQLRELGMALQRMTVEWVKEQPEQYQGDEPIVFVQKIELKSTERHAKEVPGASR